MGNVLRDIVLGEISPSQKGIYIIRFHSYEIARVVRVRETERGMAARSILKCSPSCMYLRMGSCLMGIAFQFCKMRRGLEHGCTTV